MARRPDHPSANAWAATVFGLAWLASACTSGAARTNPPSRDELVRACVRLAACRPIASAALSATACAQFDAAARAALAPSLVEAMACAARAAGDCQRLLACFAGPAQAVPCPETARPFCLTATSHWQCLVGVPLVSDCSREDLACVPDGPSTTSACGEGACDAQAFVPRCAGDDLVSCPSGAAVRRACPSGTRCDPNGGAARCVGTGPPCAPETAPRCEGTDLVTCVAGAEARTACAGPDDARVCAVPPGATFAACVGSFGECSGATFLDRCNGTRLEYCQDGRVRGLDCQSLGYLGCQIGDPQGQIPSRCRAPAPLFLDAGPQADAAAMMPPP
jgi:hypothetical protein